VRIHLYNIHGLVRKENLEIGRDADNGGQLIYLLDLAKTLSQHPDVTFVHIFTRKIDDPNFSPDYSREVEIISDKCDIRRIPFSGKRYLPKEKLWPKMDEFVTNALKHIKKHKIQPDWIHSHYADAGYVASEISKFLNVPFAHTGHSLGHPKLSEMLKTGQTEEELNRKYAFDYRFNAEETTLSHAEFIVTSTTQEISTYESYHHFENAIFHPIGPGINLDRFYPFLEDELDTPRSTLEEKEALYNTRQAVKVFYSNPEKPIILALSRPDRKKNIQGLLEAYGTDPELQAVANLAIFAGVRQDINTMPEGERQTLTEILLLMDKYNLYGKLAIPKKTGSQLEIPALYRHCASLRGVFVNVALQENFGLTTLEAASSGMPIVATEVGGPAEIIEKLENGKAVNPTDIKAIQKALHELLFDQERWNECSRNGIKKVREIYSWESHVEQYMKLVHENLEASSGEGLRQQKTAVGYSKRLRAASTLIVSDIDGTLILPDGGNPGLDELKEVLRNRPQDTLFAVATGRNLELTRQAIEEHDLPQPDALLCSVGTKIYYGKKGTAHDKGWHEFIQYRWNPERIKRFLDGVPSLKLQPADNQSDVKISYIVDDEDFDVMSLKPILDKEFYNVNIIFSHHRYVDIVPRRASKGRAIRYLASKLNIPFRKVIACGDSGNDIDMLAGPLNSVVVNNYSAELEKLKFQKNTFFANEQAAKGVLEGLRYFKAVP